MVNHVVRAFGWVVLAGGTAQALTAEYSGDVNFNGSMSAQLGGSNVAGAQLQDVTIALSSSAETAVHGQEVTFTTVASNSGVEVVTGTVTFLKDGLFLGTAFLEGGRAELTTKDLPVGTFRVQALYSGDRTYAGARSNELVLTIDQATRTARM